jgi:putative tryptophan/tyrosine transport system substrate-binding protein
MWRKEPTMIPVAAKIALALVFSIAIPSTSFAEQPRKLWRIGFLAPRSCKDSLYAPFPRGMQNLGYVEGTHYVIEWRCAEGKYERLPAMAGELVQSRVDVIVAAASPAIRAAQQATKTIPIVFPNTGDPVGSGFVASLARPGGNITGLSNINLDVSSKLLELLMAVVPKLQRVAALGNPGSSTHRAHLNSVEVDAQKAGVRVLPIEARTPEEIDRGFAAMGQQDAAALIVMADPFLDSRSRQIAALAMKRGLPSITQTPDYAKVGGLINYGNNNSENYRRAAEYVDKILKGAKPADLPVQQPMKLEMAINLKTAKALGLTIPPELLLRADEVIE